MTTYAFTPDNFHTDKAKCDHSLFVYTLDEASLGVHLTGHYELGELTAIKEALHEANRLFKHRTWVEITKVRAGFYPFYQVVRWQGGVAHPESELLDLPSACWDRLHELCKPGHASDFGWLKE